MERSDAIAQIREAAKNIALQFMKIHPALPHLKDDETMKDVSLRVDGQPIPVKPAYTSIVRSNPKNTFVGWYADVTSLAPDVEHVFEVMLPKLAPGQFQGLFFDTVEASYTSDVAGAR